MKKIFTLIIVAGLALTIQAQDITNTITANGLFKVNENDGETMFSVSEALSSKDPYVIVGNIKSGTIGNLFSKRQLNIVQESGTAGLNLYSYKAGGWNSEDKISLFHANGTIASPTVVSSNTELSSVTWYGYNGNWNTSKSAGMRVKVGAVSSGTSSPGSIIFSTVGAGSSSLTDRMTIKDDGKVGIGNNAPAAMLDVYGDVKIKDVLHLTPLVSAPSSPENGDLYVGTDNHIYCYLNGAWKQLDN